MDHEDDVTDTMPPTTLVFPTHYVDNDNNQPQHATDNDYQKGVTTNDME